ncbi:MAG TPA: response regulator [Desulfotomaculum sp.]|nr:response regulator [Desulfotomaculum sp.]HCJ78590.1 response regulator [Desulfotomaculum sp.]
MFGTRVVVADSDLSFRRKLKDILNHAGYLVTGEPARGKETLQMVFQIEPDLVVLESRLPGSEGIDVAGIIGEHMVAPVVLTVDGRRQDLGELVRKTGVYGILAKPLQEMSVLPVLETAIVCFEQVVKLQKQVNELRKKLEARRLVEQAKGLLMESKGLTEQQAYKYLQRLSMDQCLPIAKVARQVVLSLQG